MHRMRAPSHLHREKPPSVPLARILGAGAVGATAAAATLHQGTAHQRLEAQGTQFLAQAQAAALGLGSVQSHI
jgi:hypothetical protein